MPVKVVDASALGALIFNEPDAQLVAAQLGDSQLVAPALLKFEMASICLKKLNRYPEQKELILRAFRQWPIMRIEEIDVDNCGVIDLAERTRLTVYDAAYLWLTHKLSAELVTLDKYLAKASEDLARNSDAD